jgi:tetratricopeptide (TPR) repeat protein
MSWGRWLALISSGVNFCIYPYLTVFGIAGLFVYLWWPERNPKLARSLEQKQGHTLAHALLMGISVVLVVQILQLLVRVAVSLGLPANATTPVPVLGLLAAQFVFTLFHETGHLVAAASLGFHFHEMNVGPLTFTKGALGGWKLRFEWSKLLRTGGYLNSIPSHTKELRVNWMIVSLAGPGASLFLALLGLLVLLWIPGTVWEGYWTIAAVVTAVCAGDGVANLIPLGQSDGAQFLHCCLLTPRGRRILLKLEGTMLWNRATRQSATAEPSDLKRILRAAIDQQTQGGASVILIAAQEIDYASACRANGDLEEAEAVLRSVGRKLHRAPDVPPVLWCAYWLDVYNLESITRHLGSSDHAREQVLTWEEKICQVEQDWETTLPLRVHGARLRIDAGDYQGAAERLAAVRSQCPARGTLTLYIGYLVGLQGECAIHLNKHEEARKHLELAWQILCEVGLDQKAEAADVQRQLALRLTAAGEPRIAIAFFARAVEGFDALGPRSLAIETRLSWAAALTGLRRFEEAITVLEPLREVPEKFQRDILHLRARILIAEGKARLAADLLAGAGGGTRALEDGGAATVALRSLALHLSGSEQESMSSARSACDALVPQENPDAAPALLTLALAVWDQNDDLSETYLLEVARLIRQANTLRREEKVERIQIVAEHLAQAGKTEAAKRFLDVIVEVKLGKAEPLAEKVSGIPDY